MMTVYFVLGGVAYFFAACLTGKIMYMLDDEWNDGEDLGLFIFLCAIWFAVAIWFAAMRLAPMLLPSVRQERRHEKRLQKERYAQELLEQRRLTAQKQAELLRAQETAAGVARYEYQ